MAPISTNSGTASRVVSPDRPSAAAHLSGSRVEGVRVEHVEDVAQEREQETGCSERERNVVAGQDHRHEDDEHDHGEELTEIETHCSSIASCSSTRPAVGRRVRENRRGLLD